MAQLYIHISEEELKTLVEERHAKITLEDSRDIDGDIAYWTCGNLAGQARILSSKKEGSRSIIVLEKVS